MKKFSLLLTMAALMVSSSVFAGSIDYLSNQSAKYLMTFTRNASTEASADIVNYNPAGTALMGEGFFIDVSNQTLFKPYEQDFGVDFAAGFPDTTKTYEQSEPTYVLPNVYLAYNFGTIGAGKLAVYGHMGVIAGGGSLDWEDGTAGTFIALTGISAKIGGGATYGYVTSQSFEVSSVYYNASLGASYAVLDDMISISLGGKVIKADRSLKLAGTYVNGGYVKGEYEYEATGYTPVIGIDVKPIKELTLAARYEGETKLEFEYDQKELSGSGAIPTVAGIVLSRIKIYDGSKVNYNLPAMLALGAEYKVMPELAIMASGNIYFLSQADMGKTYNAETGNFVKDTNEYFGTGWEASLGAKYTVLPELVVGLGFIYTESGAKDEYFNNEYTLLNCSGNPPLDSWTIGLGATYSIAGTGADITLAGAWTHYLPEEYSFEHSNDAIGVVSGEYKKDVYNIGIGVGYKI